MKHIGIAFVAAVAIVTTAVTAATFAGIAYAQQTAVCRSAR